MTARILGIVGGTGPESTIDYYRSLVATWRRRRPDGSYPRLLIASIEAGRVMDLLTAGEYASVAEVLSEAVEQLAAGGAGMALLASNATQLAYNDLTRTASIPLVHIVDATRDAARHGKHHRLALLGTRFVMQAAMYPVRFEAAGIEIVIPNQTEQDYVHEKYLGELVAGIVLDSTREKLVGIITRMRDREGIDGIILGGTELALILTEPSYAQVPILNTTQIHVERGVDWLLGLDEPASAGIEAG